MVYLLYINIYGMAVMVIDLFIVATPLLNESLPPMNRNILPWKIPSGYD
jgi:hypothetical protein